VEDVRIAASDRVTLAGTVTVPEGEGPFPAVVLVTGSGPQDRDETLLGHKPFAVLADHLTRHGVLVLRYDDRGFGESTGDFAAATSDDFADDARAAVSWLAARPDVASVGVLGHSEGGLVAPMVANASDAVDFVVLLAGPAVPGAEILAEQARLIGVASGISEAGAEAWSAAYMRALDLLTAVPLDAPVPPDTAEAFKDALRAAALLLPDADRAILGVTGERLEATLDALLATVQTPWFRRFLVYDPQPALRALDVPTLALFGAKDLQVPPEQNAGPMRTALAASASPRHEVIVFEHLNHLFQTAETGGIQEYARIEETMSPVVLTAVADWIRSLE
jgi:pimeloyl-ACP methyl ester carboxylesterase